METITLRDGSETMDPRLDRLQHFDARSREFPLTAALPRRAVLRSKTHVSRLWLDQGREGACVSFAWHHDAGATPVAVGGLTNEVARERYFQMQREDQWPGGAYPGASPRYEGTSVLAGAQVMRALGFFDGFTWAGVDPHTRAIDDVLLALATVGPVVLGIPWLTTMFDTRLDGTLDTTGAEAGGHAIMARAVHVPRRGAIATVFGTQRVRIRATEPYVRLRNSWDRDWGLNGECLIAASELERLLHLGGEACLPVNRKRPS